MANRKKSNEGGQATRTPATSQLAHEDLSIIAAVQDGEFDTAQEICSYLLDNGRKVHPRVAQFLITAIGRNQSERRPGRPPLPNSEHHRRLRIGRIIHKKTERLHPRFRWPDRSRIKSVVKRVARDVVADEANRFGISESEAKNARDRYRRLLRDLGTDYLWRRNPLKIVRNSN